MQLAAAMAMNPAASLPTQTRTWSDLKSAYRLLNNPKIGPADIGRVHRRQTYEACRGHRVILCVQDDSDLSDFGELSRDAVKIEGEQNLMHTTLAVTPAGKLLGVLGQTFVMRGEKHSKAETRKQRAGRWKESDLWIEALADVGDAPPGCRFVTVCDRAADDLRLLNECQKQGKGFVVRAKSDRNVDDKSDKLWDHMAGLAVGGKVTVEVGTQRDTRGKVNRRGRTAKLSVRYGRVRLDKPQNHPGAGEAITVNVIYLKEVRPPADQEPIDWMLLTNETVTNYEEAMVVVGYYRRRWVIEEWHRGVKEGCSLEKSQLTERPSLLRLTALASVVGVRLIQLRDLAHDQSTAEDPRALHQMIPMIWIVIVAALAGVEPAKLTPRLFWQTVARRGGWIGRRSDGRPGWKTIWRGWRDIQQMVEGAKLIESLNRRRAKSCG